MSMAKNYTAHTVVWNMLNANRKVVPLTLKKYYYQRLYLQDLS